MKDLGLGVGGDGDFWECGGVLCRVWNPPAGLWEAGVEDVEEFTGDGCEGGGVCMDVCDGAEVGCGVDGAYGVVGGVWVVGGWCRDLGAGVEDALGVYPPDELVWGDHIRTFLRVDRRSLVVALVGMEN